MNTVVMAPMLSERDVAPGTEGGIDPLGLAAIADRLGTRLVPGVRERQRHPRFLTAIAVSLAVCEDFDPEKVAKDEVSEPWQVFEWYLVEGLARTSQTNADESDAVESDQPKVTRDEARTMRGVPGSLKARQALDHGVSLSAKQYLRTPRVFGFHGVYRLLARTLGIEDKSTGRLGAAGEELLQIWSKTSGLTGFVGSGDGEGKTLRRELHKAVADGLQKAATDRGKGWSRWQFFRDHLDLYSAGKSEADFIMQRLLDDREGYRRKVLEFLISADGQTTFKTTKSERAFHAALRSHATDGLGQLLDAIGQYEAFARLCQNAFDDCLTEMTGPGKVTTNQLGKLPSVKQAAEQVSGLIEELLARLEPFKESARLRDSCGSLASRCSPAEWASLLLQHHCDTQHRKQPAKQPWIVPMDGGHWQIRTLYRERFQETKRSANADDYVHAYRTNSLWSFTHDLKVLS